ncbi:MAG: hypothetical protein R6V12_09220, partial [Candidatus Hydrogenedentota bacterium]
MRTVGIARATHTAASAGLAVMVMACFCARAGEWTPGKRTITIPTLDISGETERHVMIAEGAGDVRQGHANTVLLADGKTMFVAWCVGHGGPAGPLKRSDDGGLTWSGLLDVPDNWPEHANCPPLYRLTDPE